MSSRLSASSSDSDSDTETVSSESNPNQSERKDSLVSVDSHVSRGSEFEENISSGFRDDRDSDSNDVDYGMSNFVYN
jgi:hypothetical protein